MHDMCCDINRRGFEDLAFLYPELPGTSEFVFERLDKDAFLSTYGTTTLSDGFNSIVDLEQVAIRREDGQCAIIRASHGCSLW